MASLSSRDIRALKVLAVFLVVSGILAVYIYVLVPQQDRLQLAREQLQTAQMQLQADLRKLEKADEAEEALNSALELLRNEESLIADEEKQAFFVRDLEVMAKKAGVELESVNFNPAKAQGRFLDIGTYIDITGSFGGIKSFYDSLEVLNRKLAVKSFSFDLEAKAFGAEGVTVRQVDVLHSICNLSLFIRPKGGAQSGITR